MDRALTQNEVQRIADTNSLDVRAIQSNHYRLIDTTGNYILDVYFKKTKRGFIIKNSTFGWETNVWKVIHSEQELLDLIKENLVE